MGTEMKFCRILRARLKVFTFDNPWKGILNPVEFIVWKITIFLQGKILFKICINTFLREKNAWFDWIPERGVDRLHVAK